MVNEDEIKAKIEQLESDERLNGPRASIFSNAPLAMIQLGLESQINILNWVLSGGDGDDTQGSADEVGHT